MSRERMKFKKHGNQLITALHANKELKFEKRFEKTKTSSYYLQKRTLHSRHLLDYITER